MTVYPRQKLYDISHTEFVSSALKGSLNNGDDAHFAASFSEFIGTDEAHVLPLARGRLSLYLATRRHVTAQRPEVVMSPFTIFDMINMAICGGGRPVFVDSEANAPHVSLSALQKAVTDSTALVVITHYHTVNPEIAEIAAFLRERGIALLEDCAISLGGRVNGQHVGTFGDYGLFSFGLFKFIATYFGGAMWVRDTAQRSAFAQEIESWSKMTASDLSPYVKKGLKFSVLTNPLLFTALTFPLFRFGYLRDIEFIKKNAVNDPAPALQTALPDSYQRRPSDFQMREWARQLANIPAHREARLERADVYMKKFRGVDGIGHCTELNVESDCFLNFPINVKDPERVLKTVMKQGFDASPYFYRNCATLACFADYRAELPNIDRYVSQMIILPTYPDIPIDYAGRLADAIRTAVDEG